MADTITIRIDADTEHALDVLTRGGANRSEAIRQAVLEAALRQERLTEMKRAFLRRPMPAPDGVNPAEDICASETATRVDLLDSAPAGLNAEVPRDRTSE